MRKDALDICLALANATIVCEADCATPGVGTHLTFQPLPTEMITRIAMRSWIAAIAETLFYELRLHHAR